MSVGERVCVGLIHATFDPCSQAVRRAVDLVRHRESSLPGGATIELVEWPSVRAEALLSAACVVDAEGAGTIVAILPTGLVLRGCHVNPMQLVFEMEYIALVRWPEAGWREDVEKHYFAPLRAALHAMSPQEARAGRWWRELGALQVIEASLSDVGFAVLDDFLPQSDAEELASGLEASRHEVGPGRWVKGYIHGAFMGGDASMGSAFTNPSGDELIRFSTDGNGYEYVRGTKTHERVTDEFVMALRGSHGRVGTRLSHLEFCHPAMLSIYPGDGTRYTRHSDNLRDTNGRRLTTILYLNKCRQPEDGGQLRIFQHASFVVKEDVVPAFNRLVAFWSSEENPHEVLPNWKERFAISLWYFCGREGLRTQGTFKDIVTSMRVVGGRARVDVLPRCAETPEQRRVLESLCTQPLSTEGGRDYGELLTAIECGFASPHEHLWQPLASLFGWEEECGVQKETQLERTRQQLKWAELWHGGHTPCVHCGDVSTEGRLGTSAFAGQWFCGKCWSAWEAEADADAPPQASVMAAMPVVLPGSAHGAVAAESSPGAASLNCFFREEVPARPPVLGTGGAVGTRVSSCAWRDSCSLQIADEALDFTNCVEHCSWVAVD